MATVIRPKLSKKNKYYVEKHRYYELKHFCLQYPSWKRAYSEIVSIGGSRFDLSFRGGRNHMPTDPTTRIAENRMYYQDRINLVEKVALEVDQELARYILKGVTEGLSYGSLKIRLDIPCSKDTYYDRYRKFFWLLNKERD